MAHTWARLWYTSQLAHALEEQQPTNLSFARNGKIAHRVKERKKRQNKTKINTNMKIKLAI